VQWFRFSIVRESEDKLKGGRGKERGRIREGRAQGCILNQGHSFTSLRFICNTSCVSLPQSSKDFAILRRPRSKTLHGAQDSGLDSGKELGNEMLGDDSARRKQGGPRGEVIMAFGTLDRWG
jgi:hypothetical protein